jgi:hypothetical protein
MKDFLDLTDLEAGSDLPRPYTSIDFLGGHVGEYVDKWIQERYGDFDSINRVRYNPKTGVVEGCNPFYVSLAKKPLEKFGMRVATHGEIEFAKMINELNPGRGLDFMLHYIDSAIVLRSTDAPNSSQAKKLAEQSGFEGKTLVIPLNLTDIEEDGRELVLGMKKFAQIYETDILDESGYFKTGDIDFQSGLPLRTCEEGDRYLHGANGGLCRMYLGTAGCIVSNTDNLKGTRPNGRVVIVKP